MADSECTNAKLKQFSLAHFTYINQFFGDQTVRELISEVFPNKKYIFGLVDTGENFQHSHHHFLIDKKTKDNICSLEQGYQNLDVNKRDTLCQSYSLLTYFGIPIHADQQQRQMDMIALYRRILANPKFIKKLDEVIHDKNDTLWTDYTHENGNDYVLMDKVHVLQKINEVLNIWERYGYWYFIGKGECPNTKRRNPLLGGRKKTKRRKALRKSSRMKY